MNLKNEFVFLTLNTDKCKTFLLALGKLSRVLNLHASCF